MLTAPTLENLTLEISDNVHVRASLEATFDSIVSHIGRLNETPDGKPFPMVLEAWPGGRWYRDLGNKTGHFWGHVQVIKPPTLIEICGPMFMSYPAISHLQYRITSDGPTSRLQLVHKAIGLIDPQHREGVNQGWAAEVADIRARAERKASKK